MKERQSKKLIIIIIVLLICLLGSISYIIYDKVFIKEQIETKEKPKEKKKNQSVENKVHALTETEQQQILSQI